MAKAGDKSPIRVGYCQSLIYVSDARQSVRWIVQMEHSQVTMIERKTARIAVHIPVFRERRINLLSIAVVLEIAIDQLKANVDA